MNLVEGEQSGLDRERERESAAHDAVDVDRLLPGENPSTEFLEDCRHWLRVYNELLQLKRRVIDSTAEVKGKVDRAATEEIEGTDMIIMRAEAERFERRQAFWQKRLAQLEKGEGSRRA